MEEVAERITKHLDKVIFCILLIVITIGILELVTASLMVESYTFGGESPGIIWDSWGVLRYPSYFIHLDRAISLFVISLILYPIWVWVSNNQKDMVVLKYKKTSLFLGLLLPSFFIYGDPGGAYSGMTSTGIELTGVVASLYNFIFSGIYGIDSVVTLNGLFPHQFALLGIWIFLLGVAQIAALYLLERGTIGIRLFLIPIIVNLIFVLLLFGNAMPSSFLPSNRSVYSYSLAQLNIPTPMLTIGILIQGHTILKIKSNQGL